VGFDSPYPIYYFSFNLPYKFHSWIPAFAGMTTIFHVWLDILLDFDYCGNDNYLESLEKPFRHPGLDPAYIILIYYSCFYEHHLKLNGSPALRAGSAKE
jgi:hypothetical protein